MALVLDAPAKINLYLAVLGRRSDGFHDVETILHEVDLCDTLVAEQISQPSSAPIELVVAADSGTTNGGIVARADAAIRGQTLAMHALFAAAAAFVLPICGPATGSRPARQCRAETRDSLGNKWSCNYETNGLLRDLSDPHPGSRLRRL